jgi:hypothetical protein
MPDERHQMEYLSRTRTEPVACVARAKVVLAVANGAAAWSLSTLQEVLRRVLDGLPGVRTYTIWGVLHDARFTWSKDP